MTNKCNFMGCDNDADGETLKQIGNNWLVSVSTCNEHWINIHNTWFTEKEE